MPTQSANLMHPYAPDLSNWDPSCRLGFFTWKDDAALLRRLGAAVRERFTVHFDRPTHPEAMSDPQLAAEELLLAAMSTAGDIAFDEYMEANKDRLDSVPDEADVCDEACEVRNEAEGACLRELCRLIVNVVTGHANG